MVAAAVVLTAAAWLRGAEYDEQYTLFLTAGTARPDWPGTVFPAGTVAALQTGHASLAAIARDLRATDVHPPFYFWAVSLWRDVFGPSLFAARMLSVSCGLVSLWLVGAVARHLGIRPLPAMLITLGCYGFVYTNAVARGFAPAAMLTLAGVTSVLSRRPVLAGVCLGAACACNYLAVFVAAATILVSAAWLAVPAMLPFLALDFWFFIAQHAARNGQFPPFALMPSILRLGVYQTAAVFGGLPMYADGIARIVLGAGIAGVTVVLAVLARRGHRLLLAAAFAAPIGLLLLGLAFNNTPIELRYLSFGLPFIALLIAQTVPTAAWLSIPLLLQAASITGLMLSPRTMQPAHLAAQQTELLAGDALVLVPSGNDGVGIVGAFGIEARPTLPIMVVHPNDQIADRIHAFHRVALAVLQQDAASTAVVDALRTHLTGPGWRTVAIRSHLEVYERVERTKCPIHRADKASAQPL